MALIAQKIIVAAAIIAIFIWLYKDDLISYKKDTISFILVSVTAALIATVLLLMFFY